jgi:MarR family 2-MHQ and catechol resistance regulon transcriptional repressor
MPSEREKAVGEIIQSFRRIIRTIDHFSAELKQKHNITGPQAGTLKIIAENGPISLTDVCGRTFRHITTVGGIVDRLERDGYVVKRRDTEDRRKVVLEATARGKQAASSAPFVGPARAMSALERLSTKEILTIRDTMQTLVRILGEEAEGGASSDPSEGPGAARAGPRRRNRNHG